MLCGSKAAKIIKLGLDQLSTFGMLEHLTQVEVVALLEALVATGHLAQVDLDQHRPVLELTTAGIELMKGQREFEGSLPLPEEILAKIRGDQPPPAAPVESEQEPLDVDPGLLTRLKEWRKQKSSLTGQPLYLILSNRTLEELAAAQPRSRDALLEVSGIGQRKLEQYGHELLELIDEESAPHQPEAEARTETPPPHQPEAQARTETLPPHQPEAQARTETPPPHQPEAQARTADSATSPRPSCYWTWRMFQAGLSLEEIAAARDMSLEAVRREQDQASRLGFH
jgi:hypothetical protein